MFSLARLVPTESIEKVVTTEAELWGRAFEARGTSGISTGMATGKSSFADIQGTHRRILAEMLERKTETRFWHPWMKNMEFTSGKI